MANEINLEELKILTQDARDFPFTTKANRIIDNIPAVALRAAQEGKDSAIVYSFENDENVIKVGDPLSQLVWDYCVKKGLNPKLRRNWSLKNGGVHLSIVINWA